MRKLTAFLLLLTFTSCQKQVTQKSTKASTINNTVEKRIIFLDYDSEGGDWWNPCSNEYVHVTGSVVIEYTYVTVNNIINFTATAHYNLTGTGYSGTKYKGTQQLISHFTYNADSGCYQSNDVQRVVLSVPGRNNNLAYINDYKFVFNANGELVVASERFVYDECR